VTGTTGSIQLRGHGFATLRNPVDLQPAASGVWVDTGLTVDLPAAGTYQLDATVRANMSAGASANVWVRAHLYDVTAAADVPASEVIVRQVITTVDTGPEDGGNDSAPILVEYTVTGPSTIRLEGARQITFGDSTAAAIATGPAGRTTLRWKRIA
jgi:hypothetical protein